MFRAGTIGEFNVGHAPVSSLSPSANCSSLVTSSRHNEDHAQIGAEPKSIQSDQLLMSNALPRLFNLKRTCFCVY